MMSRALAQRADVPSGLVGPVANTADSHGAQPEGRTGRRSRVDSAAGEVRGHGRRRTARDRVAGSHLEGKDLVGGPWSCERWAPPPPRKVAASGLNGSECDVLAVSPVAEFSLKG